MFLQLGWYEAEVQSCDRGDDEVDLVFVEEPGFVYKIPVLPNLVSGKLRIKKDDSNQTDQTIHCPQRA